MRLFSIGKYSLPLVFAFLIPLFGAFNNYISKYLRTHSSIHYFVDTSCWIYRHEIEAWKHQFGFCYSFTSHINNLL